ncbi:hypothetical protein BGZ72_002325 [Mortierella alpina]|nr:hypothetical protein BGZ72_002325 [Mortierella alpina]
MYQSEAIPDFEKTEESLQYMLLVMRLTEEQEEFARQTIQMFEHLSTTYKGEEMFLKETLQLFRIEQKRLSARTQQILSQLSDLALVLGLSDMTVSSFHQGLAQVRLDSLESTQEHTQQQKRLDSLKRHRVEAQAGLDKLQALKHQWTTQRETEGDLELRTRRRSTELYRIKTVEDRAALEETLTSRQRRRQQQRWPYQRPQSSAKDAKKETNMEVEALGLTLGQLDVKEKSVEELQKLLNAQTTSLAAYQEIPPDYALARLKVKEATMRLEELTLEHESLMTQLAEDL